MEDLRRVPLYAVVIEWPDGKRDFRDVGVKKDLAGVRVESWNKMNAGVPERSRGVARVVPIAWQELVA